MNKQTKKRMKRMLLWGAGLAVALIIVLGMRKVLLPDENDWRQAHPRMVTKDGQDVIEPTRADSLLGAALTAQDAERLSVLTDSFSALGELSPIKTDFFRGYIHYLRDEVEPATECFSRIMKENDPSAADFDKYVQAGVCLVGMLVDQYDTESALSTALPLIEKLNTAGSDKYFELKSIYISLGRCQLQLNRMAEAEISFKKASEYTKKLVSTDHTNTIDIYNAVATYSKIVTAYFNAGMTVESEPWLNLEDSLFNVLKSCSDADPTDIDMLQADILQNRSMIAETKGEKEKAARYYEEYKTTNYSKTLGGRINGSEYLSLAKRYEESADELTCLDELIAKYNMEIDLDVISSFLLPKMYVNYQAHRMDSALRVALQIYEAFDSAYSRQKESEAAKLATIYDTEGKERRIAEQQAEISQQRVVGLVVAIIFLTLAFIVYTLIRRRQAARLAEMKAAQERIESELRIARDIQMSMVPSIFPEREGLDMYASMTPAKEVGGDLYGYLLMGNKLYFAIGDVSGKGVPASLFMAQATRLFMTLAKQGMMPAEICTRMNDALSGDDNKSGMFVTFLLGLVDLTTGHLDFCNAGHNPPVIGGGESHGDFLDMIPNAPIGLWPDLEYEGEEMDTIKGRPLFIYTDGLNEAENLQQEQFGDGRLLEILRNTHFDSARQVIDTLKAEVDTHRNGAEPNDDLTMMCLRVN